MTAAQLAAELHETGELLAFEARENGHDLHPWAPATAYSNRTACRRCGARLVIVVTAAKVTVFGTASTLACP